MQRAGTRSIIDAITNVSTVNNEVVDIPVGNLVPYHAHPFELYSGERLDDMVESIRENGVLSPIIVQPAEDGMYEILAGHNRWNASKQAGKKTIPAIVKKDLSEDDAYTYVIETNVFQRGFESLKRSEQAAVIAERADKFREEKRKAICEEIGFTRADEAVGDEYCLNAKNVQRLIRIDRYLAASLKKRLDVGDIPFIGAVNLTFLTEEHQNLVDELTEGQDIPLKKCEALKAAEQEAQENGCELTDEEIEDILNGTAHKDDSAPKMKSCRITKETYDRYFPKEMDKEAVQNTIETALAEYFAKHGKE